MTQTVTELESLLAAAVADNAAILERAKSLYFACGNLSKWKHEDGTPMAPFRERFPDADHPGSRILERLEAAENRFQELLKVCRILLTAQETGILCCDNPETPSIENGMEGIEAFITAYDKAKEPKP